MESNNAAATNNVREEAEKPAVKKHLNGYVGFSNLPNQIHRKSVKKGFYFTLMVVGESGLGKSTLVNTLFNSALYPEKEDREPSGEVPKTVEIQVISGDIQENGIQLKLSVIDTPGFGDFIDNELSWRPILECIESRFDAYLEQESRVNRKKIVDNRVHALLYFIPPTGHCLRPIDVEFMKRLHHRVNLLPVIAKADTLTEEELRAFKLRIMEDIGLHKINVYQPVSDDYDDDDTVAECQELLARMPFAVIGSMQEFEVAGRKVRGRKYPWGIIEVDNEDHCDFTKLRQMLVRTHMEDLKEHTSNVLYENYRSQKMTGAGGAEAYYRSSQANPMSKLEEERKAHEAKLAKMEAEMKQVFMQKVAEKENRLKITEDELMAKHKEMKEYLEKQRNELEDKKRRLEAGKGASPEKGATGYGTVKSGARKLFGK